MKRVKTPPPTQIPLLALQYREVTLGRTSASQRDTGMRIPPLRPSLYIRSPRTPRPRSSFSGSRFAPNARVMQWRRRTPPTRTERWPVPHESSGFSATHYCAWSGMPNARSSPARWGISAPSSHKSQRPSRSPPSRQAGVSSLFAQSSGTRSPCCDAVTHRGGGILSPRSVSVQKRCKPRRRNLMR